MRFLNITVSFFVQVLLHRLVRFLLEICLIEPDPSKYFYVAQGMLTIDGIDDVEEMRLTDEAFDILGFTQVCPARKNNGNIDGNFLF